MARMILNETSYFGAGCRKEVVGEMNRRGMKKAFIVSDKDLVKFGVAKKVTDVLDGAGIAYELFDDVKANPTIHNVQCGLEAFKKAKADVIIAIGGGSVMDTAKAIGIIAENPGKTVAVTTHGGVIKNLNARVEFGNIQGLRQGKVFGNTSVSVLEAEDGVLRWKSVNDMSHLPEELRRAPMQYTFHTEAL